VIPAAARYFGRVGVLDRFVSVFIGSFLDQLLYQSCGQDIGCDLTAG
jgi:hypothetical protein